MSDQPKPDYWGNPEAAFKAGLAQGRAETAAMLEKQHIFYLHVVEREIGFRTGPTGMWLDSPKALLAAIALNILHEVPTDYAAALEEQLKEARAEALNEVV